MDRTGSIICLDLRFCLVSSLPLPHVFTAFTSCYTAFAMSFRCLHLVFPPPAWPRHRLLPCAVLRWVVSGAGGVPAFYVPGKVKDTVTFGALTFVALTFHWLHHCLALALHCLRHCLTLTFHCRCHCLSEGFGQLVGQALQHRQPVKHPRSAMSRCISSRYWRTHSRSWVFSRSFENLDYIFVGHATPPPDTAVSSSFLSSR